MELNKKLAEWAGLKLMWGRLEGKDYERTILVFNDADGYGQETLAFTQSLDACFKWLVPKLQEIKEPPAMGIEFFWDEFKEIGEGVMCEISPVLGLVDPDMPNTGKSYRGIEKTPALALCKAIEKLIDGEHKCP